MKIVIDIDEDYYERIKHDVKASHNDYFQPYNIIANGTPLPKGHGRLFDEKVIIENAVKGLNGIYDLTDMPDYIAGLPAIIPADKEEQAKDKKYKAEVITRGNCMICGEKLTDGLFLCKECGEKMQEAEEWTKKN